MCFLILLSYGQNDKAQHVITILFWQANTYACGYKSR